MLSVTRSVVIRHRSVVSPISHKRGAFYNKTMFLFFVPHHRVASAETAAVRFSECIAATGGGAVVRSFGTSSSTDDNNDLNKKPTTTSVTPPLSPQEQWLRERFRFIGNDDILLLRRTIPVGIQTLEAPVLEQRVGWIKEQLALKDDDLWKMISKNPCILCFDSEKELKPKLRFFKRWLWWDDDTLSKTLRNYPMLLNYRSEDNLGLKLEFLQNRLGDLDNEALGKLVERSPGILTLSIPNNIEPTLEWFEKRLLLDEEQLAKVVIKQPNLLSNSVKAHLQPTLEWLEDQLQLSGTETTKFVATHPDLLSHSVTENMEPKAEWLRKRLFSSSSDDADDEEQQRKQPQQHEQQERLSKALRKFPALFRCSIEKNLEPTYRFYEDFFGSREELRRMLETDPGLLSYSLERRLRPRLQQFREETGGLLEGNDDKEKAIRKIAKLTNEKWRKTMHHERIKKKYLSDN